jgi:hypothetical protein
MAPQEGLLRRSAAADTPQLGGVDPDASTSALGALRRTTSTDLRWSSRHAADLFMTAGASNDSTTAGAPPARRRGAGGDSEDAADDSGGTAAAEGSSSTTAALAPFGAGAAAASGSVSSRMGPWRGQRGGSRAAPARRGNGTSPGDGASPLRQSTNDWRLDVLRGAVTSPTPQDSAISNAGSSGGAGAGDSEDRVGTSSAASVSGARGLRALEAANMSTSSNVALANLLGMGEFLAPVLQHRGGGVGGGAGGGRRGAGGGGGRASTLPSEGGERRRDRGRG